MDQLLRGGRFTVRTERSRRGHAVTIATPVPAPPGPLVTVGDSFTDPDWTPGGWPELVAERVGLPLLNLGHSGSGYVREAEDSTFPWSVAQHLPSTAAAVIVWGGYNDAASVVPVDVARAAATTLRLVRRLAPGAGLVAVGPQWVTEDPTPQVLQLRDAVRAAAIAEGAVWADPIDERWLVSRPELLLPDGLHPGPQAQELLADRMTPLVQTALAATRGDR